MCNIHSVAKYLVQCYSSVQLYFTTQLTLLYLYQQYCCFYCQNIYPCSAASRIFPFLRWTESCDSCCLIVKSFWVVGGHIGFWCLQLEVFRLTSRLATASWHCLQHLSFLPSALWCVRPIWLLPFFLVGTSRYFGLGRSIQISVLFFPQCTSQTPAALPSTSWDPAKSSST